ncbi:thiolase family protein [Pseudonocardia oroxyli]|uniref:propanoyl-CoA C-acyltransferase n=1 Tax=Pseudonocardia oroxyli TaxID=366584 RepID=A0A1G7X7M5_PSEOR|nr:thiolase family protein [Pseudonocardia oroxyli]SDG80172.1 acetyl-CoA C-acetyltransferase [Pseudonocardia oroxyli]
MTVAIEGVGTSGFGRQPDVDLVDLAFAAVDEAFRDAGGPRTVDAVWVGTVFGPAGVAQRVLRAMGLTGMPVLTVENACASGTTAFAEACEAVRTGRYGRVLALGIERMGDGAIVPEPTDPEGRTGLALPALYAMAAARWLHEGRTTLEQLAAVAVKNKANALANPRAPFGGRFTVAEVLASRPIADPLTLLQCCPTSDGAAAAIVGRGGSGGGGVRVRSVALRSGAPWNHRSREVWGHDLVRDTGAAAFAAAGLGPEDVDVAEVHDAFTIGELVTTAALGLKAPHIVNPSGGLLSRGHPLGATGLAQLAEIVWQLRGRAGGRQVGRARIGLVETMGGGVSVLDGNACVVAVLEAP